MRKYEMAPVVSRAIRVALRAGAWTTRLGDSMGADACANVIIPIRNFNPEKKKKGNIRREDKGNAGIEKKSESLFFGGELYGPSFFVSFAYP